MKDLTVSKREPIDFDGKLQKRQELVKFLENKLANLITELETKEYTINGGVDIAKGILEFIETKAEWKFTEAMGIVESKKQLTEIVSKLKADKKAKFTAHNLLLEAMYYFLTKVTGTGVKDAEAYYNLLKPILEALGEAKNDREIKNQIEKDLGTLQSAIDTGAASELEDKMIEEMELEMEADLAILNLQ
jgi:hypothetical protein